MDYYSRGVLYLLSLDKIPRLYKNNKSFQPDKGHEGSGHVNLVFIGLVGCSKLSLGLNW